MAIKFFRILSVTFFKFKIFAFGLNVSCKGKVGLGKRVDIRVTDGGAVVIGDGAHLSDDVQIIVSGGVVTIGESVFLGKGAVIVARNSIAIGNDVQIAEYVTIRDQDHRVLNNGKPLRGNGFEVDPVNIGDNVWLGAKVTVTKGVAIKKNAVVGANSVVTNNVAENEIVAGCPARVIRSY